MPKGNRKWKDSPNAGKGKDSRQNARPYPLSNPRGRQQYSGPFTSYTNPDSVSEQDTICAAIPRMANLASLSDQMTFIYEHLSLTPDDHRLRKVFLDTVESHFKYSLSGRTPCCYLYAFGSTINELGMKNCDLDMVLLTNGLVDKVWTGPVPNTRSLLNNLIHELYKDKHSLGITNIVPIRAARVPLIKFCHINTDMDCDISFNRRMGVLNTFLIASVMQFSRSAKLLAFTLKLWGKQKGFVGGGGMKMNSYSMTLMVIFFLQNVGVIPPLKHLQGSHNTINDEEGESFVTTVDDFLPFRGRMKEFGLSELLTGFLAYYIRFPFETSIISVFHGQPLPISDRPNFNARFINIQDPFEKDFNTAKGVKESMRDWFKKCLCLTYVHRELLCPLDQQSQPWGLQYLLQPVEYVTNEKAAQAKLRETHNEKGRLARAKADYYRGGGRTMELDIPYRRTGCPTRQYVKCCVEVVRALKEVYGMIVSATWSQHPLSEPIKEQVTGRAKLPYGGEENEPFAAVPQFAEVKQSEHEGVKMIPLEFFMPFTVQVRNKVSTLYDTADLDKDRFNYDKYVKELKASSERKVMRHSDFAITFQPHDTKFNSVDLEVINVNSCYIDAIYKHLQTVIPKAIQRRADNS